MLKRGVKFTPTQPDVFAILNKLENREIIEKAAKELIRKRELTGTQFKDIVEGKRGLFW